MAVDTSTTAIPVGESRLAAARRSITRPLRRAARFIATSDPDLSRLRSAGTTITCLVAVAIVLFALSGLTGLPGTAVIPGLIVTMLACNAVREPRPGPRAVSILLLIPSSVAAVSIAAATHDVPLVSYVVFVVIAMAAVFVRIVGQRGVSLGMVAFMSYFIAIFTRVTPEQIPVVAGAVTIAALIVILLRYLLRPRHPERDLRRLLRALGVRAGRVLDVLDDGVRAGVIDERLHRSATSRLAASSSTAAGAEQALDSADHPLVTGIGNDQLSIRVFDFQLMLERLHSIVRRVLLDQSMSDEQRRELSSQLRRLRRAVHAPLPVRSDPEPAVDRTPFVDQAPTTTSIPIAHGHGSHVSAAGVSDSDERLESLSRVMRFGFQSWQGIATAGTTDTPGAAVSSPHDDDPQDPADATEQSRWAALPQLARTAVQVGLAAALSIAAGTALSPTRWFWAVIAAFVVYVGTSTRGEILTKGWQRIVGTLGGVVFGVLLAGVVGGHLVISLVLIVACLFIGFYFMQVSSAWMIFGITTMLALLYGLLGEFSVDLLLLRLEETAVGAMIGILVSFVVFPTSTRDAMRAATREFLDELSASLDTAATRLAADAGSLGADDIPLAAPDDARALRDAFVALTTTSRPITRGWAGVSNRSGSRRTLVILGACEYHGRALLRLADGALGAADTPALRDSLDAAIRDVRANIDAFVGAIDTKLSDVRFTPAGDVIDQLEDHRDLGDSRHHRALIGVARHLHAIDQALCGRAAELGATVGSPAA